MLLRLSALVLVAGVLGACDAPPSPSVDAGTSPDSSEPGPLPPLLTPCAPGWREVTDAHGQVTCDPYPEDGYRGDCGLDEAHWTGTPTCARVGTECPEDGWPADLPIDRPIIYVDDDAAPGGDGSSREAALRTIVAATTFSAADAIIAVATGRYDESVFINGGRTLWGACVSGTQLIQTTPSATTAVLALGGTGSARNLSVDSPESVGLLLDGTASVLEDVVIHGARRMGIYVRAGTTTAHHLVIRETRADVDGSFGHGLEVRPGAHFVIDGAVLERNREQSIAVDGADALLEARDLAIVDTQPNEVDRTYGYAVAVSGGARVVLEHGYFFANREVGLFADGSTLEARDVVVRRTEGQEVDGASGEGIVVQNGGTAILERVVLDENRSHGLIAGDGSTVDASDLVIRDTRTEQSTSQSGRGLSIQTGAHLVLQRALLDRNQNAGITAHMGAIIEAHDVVVRDTQPQESDGTTGVGVWAESDARITLTDARVESSRLVGIASLLGAVISLDRVEVIGVLASACASTTCPDRAGGFGLLAQFGGTLTASHFSIDDAALCGVTVGESSAVGDVPCSMDLSDGVIAHAPVGACVQAPMFDSSRLQPRVDYSEVDVPLVATSYALPSSL